MSNENKTKNSSNPPEFLKGLSDLVLITDRDNIWLESAEVRRAWYIFFTSFLVTVVILAFSRILFAGGLRFSPFITEVFRILRLVGFVIVLLCLIWLGYQFYKNLLITGKDLRFESITFFIILEVILFGLIYNSLYFIQPELFKYQSPSVIPTATFVDYGLPTLISSLEFTLYSACTNISISYPKIASNSSIVSVVNFFQVLVWLALMGLFIATFVQLAAKRKK